jgi:hypothetical protein
LALSLQLGAFAGELGGILVPGRLTALRVAKNSLQERGVQQFGRYDPFDRFICTGLLDGSCVASGAIFGKGRCAVVIIPLPRGVVFGDAADVHRVSRYS